MKCNFVKPEVSDLESEKHAYPISTERQHQLEFSFNYLNSANNTQSLTLREDLKMLERQQIIDLLIEQIQENRILKIKNNSLENSKVALSKGSRHSSSERIDKDLPQKYYELTQYVEQYINNTNQAQHNFLRIISDLREQNKILKQTILQAKDTQKFTQTIKNLQQSISNHISINNEISRKYERLVKQNQLLTNQLGERLKENSCIRFDSRNMFTRGINNCIEMPFKEVFLNQDFNSNQSEINTFIAKDLQNKNRLLQIQNKETSQRLQQTEKMLQKKSHKIRQLLAELQRASEEKWSYKEEIMEWRSKYHEFESTPKRIISTDHNQDTSSNTLSSKGQALTLSKQQFK